MQEFNINHLNIFQLFQAVQPILFYKGVFALLAFGFIIFHLVIWYQVRSMDRIITQPLSSTILGFISLAFIASGIGLLILIFAI